MSSKENVSVAMMWVGLAIVLMLLVVAYLVGRQQKKCEVSDCSASKNEVKRLSGKVNVLENELKVVRDSGSSTEQKLTECVEKISDVEAILGRSL